jgi:hypothetical protein
VLLDIEVDQVGDPRCGAVLFPSCHRIVAGVDFTAENLRAFPRSDHRPFWPATDGEFPLAPLHPIVEAKSSQPREMHDCGEAEQFKQVVLLGFYLRDLDQLFRQPATLCHFQLRLNSPAPRVEVRLTQEK